MIYYTIFCMITFILSVWTCIEDDKLAAEMKVRYAEKGIKFIYISDPLDWGGVVFIGIVSFVPVINLMVFISTILYRRGLL